MVMLFGSEEHRSTWNVMKFEQFIILCASSPGMEKQIIADEHVGIMGHGNRNRFYSVISSFQFLDIVGMSSWQVEVTYFDRLIQEQRLALFYDPPLFLDTIIMRVIVSLWKPTLLFVDPERQSCRFSWTEFRVVTPYFTPRRLSYVLFECVTYQVIYITS